LYHVDEILSTLDVETTLVKMTRTKTIAESKIKTDKIDAKTIAHCLRTGFIVIAYKTPKLLWNNEISSDIACLYEKKLSNTKTKNIRFF